MSHQSMPPLTRREALRSIACGFPMAAFGVVAADRLGAATTASALMPREPHFPATAKRMIFIFLRGGLSQIDSFDRKPVLDKYDGKALPYDVPRTEQTTGNLMKSPFAWKTYGSNGVEVSELFPSCGEIIDEFCIVRSMISDIPNHGPGILMFQTGLSRAGRPSMGSWIVYGLGTENQNLPGYVCLNPAPGAGGGGNSGSAFLPAIYQGTAVPYAENDPSKVIQYLQNKQLALASQRRQVDLLKQLNQMHVERLESAPELEASIQSMEIAFRMQTAAPEVFDIRNESPASIAMYGDGDFARGCLMARRLVEKGVRIVQVFHGDWDHHADINGHKFTSRQVDRPIAALVKDLKQRGMLNDTIVLVGTEFGRTPVVNLGGFRPVHNGRDHNNYGFTVLVAGGGFKPGTIYGSTDDFGFKVAENPVHVHDLHATVLHALGLNHERLTYRFSGRDMRLTDVEGHLVKPLLS
jgi:hypothetical protein